jgi:hypothetical protein
VAVVDILSELCERTRFPVWPVLFFMLALIQLAGTVAVFLT